MNYNWKVTPTRIKSKTRGHKLKAAPRTSSSRIASWTVFWPRGPPFTCVGIPARGASGSGPARSDNLSSLQPATVEARSAPQSRSCFSSLPSKRSGGPRASGGFTIVATAAAACGKSAQGSGMKRKRRDGESCLLGEQGCASPVPSSADCADGACQSCKLCCLQYTGQHVDQPS